ncbi:MAG TPA: peptidyl-prolyl cis-trans isomerase [Candidatus Limnocylindria bacterium]|nr:peptidyl-prolyl cis-trans isomerase [Candidatus Limnocylindria bacterium]
MSARAAYGIRWLAGLALVALTATALAAPASNRSGKRAGAKRDTVLVRIGNETITPSVVQRRLDELPEGARSNFTSPEGRQRLLERLVEERVWLHAALKHGLSQRADVKKQIEQQRRDLLIRTYVNEVMAAKPAPADSDARIYYQAHLEEYKVPATVAISHIQLKSEAEAKRVKQTAMRKGQDWRKLVAQYSADTLTKKNGGVLGSVTAEGLFATLGAQPELANMAFALPESAIGGPTRTDRGWHVIRVEQKREAGMRTFDQMRSAILRQLATQRSQDFYQEQLQKARKELGVRPDSAAIKSFVSQRKTAREMFNEAQAAGPPSTRIEAYRSLLRDYPTSEVGPQAQFMIGFIHSEELKDYDGAETAFRALLAQYPKSELASSAQWMIDHMRTEDVPSFMNLESDSLGAAQASEARSGSGKP